MNRRFLALLIALAVALCGCPSNAPTPQVDASDFEAGLALDASVDAASHRLGSFNPTCTGTGLPHVVSGVQTGACALVSQTADVTGVLPVANGGTHRSALGTGLQVLRTNAGATDTEWATLSGGGSSTGSANAVQTSDGAGGFLAPANVTATSGSVNVGVSPSSTGSFNMASGGSIYFRNNGNTADVPMVSKDTGDNLLWGGSTGVSGAHNFLVPASTPFNFKVNGAFVFQISGSTAVLSSIPIIGDSVQTNSPYSVHGKVTDSTVGTFALASSSYKYDAIMLSGGTAGTVTFPTPGSDAAAYYKTVINTSGVTKTLTDGGASTPTLATALSGHYLFDTAGVHLTGPSVAYP